MSPRTTFLAVACLASVATAPATAAASAPVPDRYVVVLEDGASQSSVVDDHRQRHGARPVLTYGHALKGYAAKLSPAQLAAVESDPRVDQVVQDRVATTLSAQSLPTGINRVDADVSTQLAGDGAGVTPGNVAIYDSGIAAHPDLDIAGGVNCIAGMSGNDGTIGDQYGHGTHVAGTVGARDDLNGVVGVAPGVRLWSVRVNNAYGQAQVSTQLCGIDWLTANGPGLGIKVVNSSQVMVTGLADDGNCGFTNGDVLHKAICRSTQAGLLWVFGAGNSAVDFHRAAGPSYNEVLTVTGVADGNGQPNVGTTQTFSCTTVTLLPTKGKTSPPPSYTDDTAATFSSWAVSTADQAHTVAAPGVCINSTFKGQGYALLSGTSMAAPHVTGAVQLCLNAGRCTGTPAEIVQTVRADAAAHNAANPGFGFKGDPLHAPVAGRYYGYAVSAGLY